ncbi:hypothetical protein AAZX31_01G058300 [Glycine max]
MVSLPNFSVSHFLLKSLFLLLVRSQIHLSKFPNPLHILFSNQPQHPLLGATTTWWWKHK